MPRALAPLLIALLSSLGSCAMGPTSVGVPVVDDNGIAYSWQLDRDGQAWSLFAEAVEQGQDKVIDSGAFDQVIGPVHTPGGVAWARSLNGEWTAHQVRVSDTVAHRNQGVADAVAAAWLLQRVSRGHSPGNAADLAALGRFARAGKWPQ
jgi:hypothetical protein